jgi:hypothetical membrane protein
MPAERSEDLTLKILAVGGILAAVVDVLMVVWLGSLDPSYSHVRQFISELLEPGRPYTTLYAVWCVIWSLLYVGFAVALGRELRGQQGAWLGPAALFVVAAAGSVVGFFPCDPGGKAETLSGQIHLLTGGWIATVAMILAMPLTWIAMRQSEAWRGYRILTLATGVLLAICAGWLAVCHYGGFDRSVCAMGLVQRVHMGVFYLWTLAIAIRLLRRKRIFKNLDAVDAVGLGPRGLGVNLASARYNSVARDRLPSLTLRPDGSTYLAETRL